MNTKTFVLLTIVVFAGAWFARADEPFEHPEWEKRAVLQAGQEVYGDYFSFGPHVEVSGVVHGDVYAAGGDVLIDGVVDGDLIVAGGAVTVSGHVGQDARVAGGMVTLSGRIDRNASIAGGDIHLTDAAQIHGNLLAGAGNLHVAGEIARDARIGAGTVTISDRIGGDLAVAATHIRLTSKASVGRNFRYWSEDEPSIDDGAIVLGTINRRDVPESLKRERFSRGLTGMWIGVGIISFVSTLCLGLLLLRVYPVFTPKVASTIHERPWASLGLGGATLFSVPLLIVLCLITVLGIPIALMLGAIYGVTLYVGRVFVMLWAGQRVLQLISDRPSPSWTFVTGLIAYSLIALVPLIGKLVVLLTVAAGVGAMLLTKKELVAMLREQRVV
ncbi:hypothetical protein [Petrachloros mirabilis]